MKAVLFTFLAVAMLIVDANAQTIQGLGEQLNSEAAKLPALNQIMADATDANVALKKENDVYVADQKQKTEWVKTAVAQQESTVKAPLEAKSAQLVEDYNSHCAPNRVGKLPPDQYNACVQWKSRVDQEVANNERQWADYAAKWNAQNLMPIQDVMAKQNARMAKIAELVKANFKRFTDAQDGFTAAKRRIDKLTLALKAMCDPKTASSADRPFTQAERMKWCSGIDFDGFSRKLPPMYKYQGTGGASSN